MIQICSLGGGVASTALFLMSLHGEIENPCSHAVFADTGAELETTYNTISKLAEYAKPFNVSVHITKSYLGDIISHNLQKPPDKHVGSIPFYTRNFKGEKIQTAKYCTNYFKMNPNFKLMRKLGASSKSPASNWLGYTVDEVARMKPSRLKYVIVRYPLIEKRIWRDQCYRYLEKYGFDEVVSSACWCCPFRRNQQYAYLSETEHKKAVAFEKDMNERGIEINGEKLPLLRIHRSLQPLSEKPHENANQGELDIDDVCDGGSCWT